MKDHELRFSDTNSADDSEGKTWGLDGNLFWFIVAGVFLFVVTLLFLFSALRCSFGQSFGIAIIPLREIHSLASRLTHRQISVFDDC